MNPAFSSTEIKKLVPVFFHHAARVGHVIGNIKSTGIILPNQLTAKWKDILQASLEEAVTLDIPSWTSRATLDAIGEGLLSSHAQRFVQSSFIYLFSGL